MAIYREQCAERSAIALYSVDFGADSHYSGEFAEPARSIRDVLAQEKGVAKRDGDENDERGEAKRDETKRDGAGRERSGSDTGTTVIQRGVIDGARRAAG